MGMYRRACGQNPLPVHGVKSGQVGRGFALPVVFSLPCAPLGVAER